MNAVEKFERQEIERITQTKSIPEFRAGDSIRVSVKVIEGANERLQAYEGVVIAIRNRGIATSVLVRKISHGVGVERRFLIYSPIVDSIKVTKRGIVRRAKLYYLRNLSGKSARIKERI